MDLFELAQAFKAARLQQNLSQHKIATRTGISITTISKFESGAVSELGVAKLALLLNSVKLGLYVREVGHGRTLDDIAAEQLADNAPLAPQRQRAYSRSK